MTYLILWSIGLLVLLTYSIYVNIGYSKDEIGISENTVVNVIDGDTFELYNGERVRIICIDAPELDKRGGVESRAFLNGLINGREVTLENDTDDLDSYGRLLRYVYVGDVFVNRELVKEGYAKIFRYGNNTRRCNEIVGLSS